MAYDRKAAGEQLRNQTKQNYQKKDAGGFTSILKSDLPVWKCGDGKHQLDIIPFTVGSKHPTLKKGSFAYMMEIWSHYGVGVNEDTFLCLNKMYGEDCPVCEYRKQLDDEGETDKDTLKSYKPKQYTLYNIQCHDNSEEKKKGIQLWNVSHYFFESKLLAIAEDKSGEIIPYSDPDVGRTIYFQRKGTGAGNTNFIGHRFELRDKPISDALLNAAHSLDECIVKPSYEEVYDALYGKRKSAGDEGTRERVKKADDEVVDDVPAAKGVDPDDIGAMSRKELTAFISDHNLDIDPDEFDEKSRLAEAVINLISGDAAGNDAAGEGEDVVCPHKGGTLGASFDEYKECPNCPYMDQCSEEFDKIKAAKQPALKQRSKR